MYCLELNSVQTFNMLERLHRKKLELERTRASPTTSSLPWTRFAFKGCERCLERKALRRMPSRKTSGDAASCKMGFKSHFKSLLKRSHHVSQPLWAYDDLYGPWGSASLRTPRRSAFKTNGLLGIAPLLLVTSGLAGKGGATHLRPHH